ncbi:MAG: hypothetical protein U0Q16_16265 [Bryobacteraceae bacterium]
MRLVYLFLCCWQLVGEAQEIRPLVFTKADRALRVATPRGEQAIPVRTFDADLTYSNGRSALGYFTVLYDPTSRHFLWNYDELPADYASSEKRPHIEHPDGFAHGWTHYVTDQRILLYHGGPTMVVFWESGPDVAATLDEAEAKALAQARVDLGNFPARSRRNFRLLPTVKVGLQGELSKEFFYKPWDSFPKVLEILSFAQLPDGNLELTVQAYWKEKLVLDPRFKILSHQKVP